MEKHKAIPEGYMTVGEVAKKMDVTIRTLQYYDKKGLLIPSSESEGGRRLYSHKDVIKLHQILSLKYLGFSLKDIKKHLVSLDTPQDVVKALDKQATHIRDKIKNLTESLKDIEVLQEEVRQMKSVDFKKYADIIVNLQMKNKFYWIIKHLDDSTLDYFRNKFDKDSGLHMMTKFSYLFNEIVQYERSRVLPESQKAQELIKEFWGIIMEITGGNITILSRLIEIFDSQENEWKQKQASANTFIEKALEVYFKASGNNPLEEGGTK